LLLGLCSSRARNFGQEKAVPQTKGFPEISSGQPSVTVLGNAVDDIGVKIRETHKNNAEDHTIDHQQFVTLENDEICVRVNNVGAGIQEVKLKKCPTARGQDAPSFSMKNAHVPALVLCFNTLINLC
jgi:hypothetical protein